MATGTTDIAASNTDPLIVLPTVPVGSAPAVVAAATAAAAAATTNLVNDIWVKLAALAFADGIHDFIIRNDTDPVDPVKKWGNVDAPAKTWQCDVFYHVLPTPLVVTKCTAGATATHIGLQIPEKCKRGSLNSIEIEPNALSTVSPDTIENIITNSLPAALITAATPDGFDLTTLYNLKRYKVKSVEWGGTTPIPENHPSVCGATLMQTLGMKDGSAVLIDFDYGMTKQFKKGPHSDMRLYWLMLPEGLADSAPKKPWKPAKMFTTGATSGIRWCFAGRSTANYPPWSNNNRNTFFSNYTCNMVADWTPTIKKCTQEWLNGGTLLFKTNDAHTQNNAPAVQGYRWDVPGSTGNDHPLTTAPSAALANQLKSLKYQRKRSGDQLQALALKRMTNTDRFHISTNGQNPPAVGATTYTDLLIPGLAGSPAINPKGDSFLITHDRVCLAYALHLGINVIFVTSVKGTGIKTMTSFKIETTNLPASTPAGTFPGNLNDNTN